MTIKFRKSDRNFLKSIGVSAGDATLEEDRLALAQRISKHEAPAQVKVNPQAAKRQLIRLNLEKLLDASEEQTNRCRRPSGTFRAWFQTAQEAVAFAENPANQAYQGDVAVRCQKSGCGGWHLSQPHWPDARAAVSGQEN